MPLSEIAISAFLPSAASTTWTGPPVGIGLPGLCLRRLPGTSTWNTLFPRLDNALGNIRRFVRDGLDAGSVCILAAQPDARERILARLARIHAVHDALPHPAQVGRRMGLRAPPTTRPA